jgi:hypothetical protein
LPSWSNCERNSLTFVVGSILDVDLKSERLHLFLGVSYIDEVSESDALHTVAGGADLLVNLVSTADRSVIEGVEGTFEVEAVAQGRNVVLVAQGRRSSDASKSGNPGTLK